MTFPVWCVKYGLWLTFRLDGKVDVYDGVMCYTI